VPFETTRKLDFYELHSEEFENGHFPKESTTSELLRYLRLIFSWLHTVT